MIDKYLKMYLAGVCIGIGGFIYLSVQNPLIGAIFFSFGLLTIMEQKYILYTGKIGKFVNSYYLFDRCMWRSVVIYLLILVFNFLGAGTVGLITHFLNNSISPDFMVRVNNGLGHTFIASIMCGILMYLAVTTTNKILTSAAVAIFILCGFEHCIADFYYWSINPVFNTDVLWFFVVCVLGNSVGAICFNGLNNFNKKWWMD